MTTLVTPPADRVPWPTLGPQVCRFIEEELVRRGRSLKQASLQEMDALWADAKARGL